MEKTNNHSSAQYIGVSEATGGRVWKLSKNGGINALALRVRGHEYGKGRSLTTIQELEM